MAGTRNHRSAVYDIQSTIDHVVFNISGNKETYSTDRQVHGIIAPRWKVTELVCRWPTIELPLVTRDGSYWKMKETLRQACFLYNVAGCRCHERLRHMEALFPGRVIVSIWDVPAYHIWWI